MKKIDKVIFLLLLFMGMNAVIDNVNAETQENKIIEFASSTTINDVFPDDVLANEIASILDVSTTSEITDAQLTGITGTFNPGSGVQDLTGIQYLTGVSTIHIENGDLASTSLSPLSSLTTNLINLELVNDNISDISELTALGNNSSVLESINLENNTKLVDISPLSHFKTVTSLSLDGDLKVTNINPIGDMSNLKSLSIDNMGLTSINGINSLTNLSEFSASNNKITSLCPLVSSGATLKYLNVPNNKLDVLTCLKGQVSDMKYVNIDSNNVHNIYGFSGAFASDGVFSAHDEYYSIGATPTGTFAGPYASGTYPGVTLPISYSFPAGWTVDSSNNISFNSADTFSFDAGAFSGTYSVVDKSNIVTNEEEIYVGDAFDPEEIFVSAKNTDGSAMDYSDMTVESNVDTSKVGEYVVTYSFDSVIGKRSKDTKITVADKSDLEVKDETIYVGDVYNPRDTFVSAKDIRGDDLNYEDMTVEGVSDVNTLAVGNYVVTYSFVTPAGIKTASATIIVANLSDIQVHNVDIYAGEEWDPIVAFDSATDVSGGEITFDSVKVTGDVDIYKEGNYDIIYSIDTPIGEKSATATVTVVDEGTLDVHDEVLYVGDVYDKSQTFTSATDVRGASLDVEDLTVEGDADVNTSIVADYPVTYINGLITKTITVSVEDLSELVVPTEFKIYVGDTYDSYDPIVSAIDERGTPVTHDKITVDGEVDPNLAGEYDVTYSFDTPIETKTATTKVIVQDFSSLNANNQSIYAGDDWNPELGFVSATDVKGDAITFDDVTVSGSVDIKKAGDYPVSYSIDTPIGPKVVNTVVTVIDKSELEVKDSTIYAGDSWDPQDNLAKAIDIKGNILTIDDLTTLGKVNTKKAGTYKVMYILHTSVRTIEKTATITVLDESSIYANNKTMYAGESWTPLETFAGATDVHGVEIPFSEINIDGDLDVDTNKAGTYKVTYSIDTPVGVKTAVSTITVISKESLEIKDTTIYVGDSYNKRDTFLSATDVYGKKVGIDDIDVVGSEDVDTTKVGEYPVTYTNGSITKVATVNVKDLSELIVKDEEIFVGDTWDSSDTLVSAKNVDGSEVTDMKVDGTVNTKIAGEYEITYSFNTPIETKSEVATITVEDLSSLKVRNKTIYREESFNPEDTFVSATDVYGNKLEYSDLSVEGDDKVDTSEVGVYKEIYSLKTPIETKKSVANVRVVSKETLELKDSTIYVGDTYNPMDNFLSATDIYGKKESLDDLTLEGAEDVDTTKVGNYQVKYINGAITKFATVTVADYSSLEVQDKTVYRGESWVPSDSLVNATDIYGKTLSVDDLVIDGAEDVDTSKVGTYEVTYNLETPIETKTEISSIAVVDKETLNVIDKTVYIGGSWNPSDSFVDATDVYGNPLGVEDLTVEGSDKVDTKKEGVYPVTYTNGLISKVSNVTVVDLSTLVVDDKEIYVGDSWTPNDSFVSATNVDGTVVPLDDIDVEGNVDTNVANEYEVTYSFATPIGIKSETVTITVKDLSSLEIKDINIFLGDSYDPKDTFVAATDVYGNPLYLDDINVESNIDVSKAGNYTTTYSFDTPIGTISKTANVIVSDYSSLVVNDKTIFLGQSYDPKDTFVSATDVYGDPIPLSKITVVGDKDVEIFKAGNYEVTYSFDKPVGVMSKTIVVTVSDYSSLNVTNQTLYVGDVYNPEDGFLNATDEFGNELYYSDMTITGAEDVDTSKSGNYEVIYSFTTGGVVVTKTAVVSVVDLSSLEVMDQVVSAGDSWDPVAGFIGASDTHGNPLQVEDIDIEGSVDTTKPGIYTVKYINGSIVKTVTVEVVDKSSLNVSDETIYVGDTYRPIDTFVSATDMYGNSLSINDIVVEGDVDTTKPGTYKVTYKYNDLSSVATITVLQKIDLTSLEVKNITINIGDKWKADDSFVSATDASGNPLNINDIKVEGSVDSTKPGNYEVRYTNGLISKVAVVTVKDNLKSTKIVVTGMKQNYIILLLLIAVVLLKVRLKVKA